MHRDTRPGQFFMPTLGPCKCSLTRQFLLDDLVICKGVLFITEIYCNLLITRQFSAVYRLTQFIKVSINLTIYIRLPGLLNQNQIWTKGEKLRTFYNTVGLVNCLRPIPGHNPDEGFLLWPADALLAPFFAKPLIKYTLIWFLQTFYRDTPPWQLYRDETPPALLPGLAKNASSPDTNGN